MRLDHLLSRDLGVCGGRGARTGASRVLSWPVGGAGRTAREHAPLSPCVLLGGWGVPALPRSCGGGVGACCRGLGLRALCVLLLLPPVVLLLFCGGGVGGCGGVGGLVVNCIVDASIFVLCGVFLLCASRPGPAALFVVWWVLGVVCLCCVLFLWAFGGCLGTRGR